MRLSLAARGERHDATRLPLPFSRRGCAAAAAQEHAGVAIEAETAAAAQPTLAELLWVARPLVVFADTPARPALRAADAPARGAIAEPLIERDVVVLTDTDPAGDGPLRQQLRPRGFGVVLIDLDGTVAQRRPVPTTAREIINLIDRMPSRRQETGSRRRDAVRRPQSPATRGTRCQPAVAPHSNSMDHVVDRQAVARRFARITSSTDPRPCRSAPAARSPSSSPRPCERLAVEDLVALGHVDAHHQPRHRAEQELRGVRRRLLRHQRRQLGMARRQHARPSGRRRGSRSRKPPAIRPHLQHQRLAVDVGRASGCARLQSRRDAPAAPPSAKPTVRAASGRASIVTGNGSPASCTTQSAPDLALVVVHRARRSAPRRDLGDPRAVAPPAAASRRSVASGSAAPGEALGILLGDEGGGDLALRRSADGPSPPTGTAGCARSPRPRSRRAPSRIASIAARPVRRPGAELGDHRVVVHRDLAALEDAGVVAHRRAARPPPPSGGR